MFNSCCASYSWTVTGTGSWASRNSDKCSRRWNSGKSHSCRNLGNAYHDEFRRQLSGFETPRHVSQMKMGHISKGVANTLKPSKKYTKKLRRILGMRNPSRYQKYFFWFSSSFKPINYITQIRESFWSTSNSPWCSNFQSLMYLKHYRYSPSHKDSLRTLTQVEVSTSVDYWSKLLIVRQTKILIFENLCPEAEFINATFCWGFWA